MVTRNEDLGVSKTMHNTIGDDKEGHQYANQFLN
jgi:hypothetical protein